MSLQPDTPENTSDKHPLQICCGQMVSPSGFEIYTTTIYFHIETDGPDMICRLVSMKVTQQTMFYPGHRN
jgi:hypothetical protein